MHPPENDPAGAHACKYDLMAFSPHGVSYKLFSRYLNINKYILIELSTHRYAR